MRMRSSLVAALMATGLIVTANDALAQQGTAEIRGRVRIRAAPRCRAPRSSCGTRRAASTGTASTVDGSYFLTGVTPGVYELTAELSGFKKYAPRTCRLEVGKTATVDVPLEVGGLERGADGLRGGAARRRHVQGGRRQHHAPAS